MPDQDTFGDVYYEEDPESFDLREEGTPSNDSGSGGIQPPSNGGGGGGGPPSGGGSPPSGIDNDIKPINIPEPQYPPDMDLGEVPSYPPVVLPNDIMELRLTKDMYPQEGYIPKYVRWSEGTTDAPRAFHLIGAMATLSAALGDNWTADFAGGQNVNFFALLIAGSGSRKSTALRRALTLIPQDLKCASALASTPAFVKQLADNPRTFWYLDEADTLFHVFQQKFGSDLATRMVTAYDCEPTIYSSLTQGDIVANNPYITLVTGTALEWLKDRKLTANLLRGGLISRFWLIPAKKERLLAAPPPPDKVTEDALRAFIDDVYRISNLGIQYRVAFEKDAFKLLLRYQIGRGEAPHTNMSGVWNRAMDHIARIALLFHVSCFRRGQDRIQEDSVHQAINLWHNFLLRGHYWAVMNLVATDDPVAEYEQEILAQLDSKGGCLSVAQLNYGRGFKVREALFNLYLRERLVFWGCRKKAGVGRPKFYVTFGQKPKGFSQAEKKLPLYLQKMVETSGMILDEVDLPYDSETFGGGGEQEPEPQKTTIGLDDLKPGEVFYTKDGFVFLGDDYVGGTFLGSIEEPPETWDIRAPEEWIPDISDDGWEPDTEAPDTDKKEDDGWVPDDPDDGWEP